MKIQSDTKRLLAQCVTKYGWANLLPLDVEVRKNRLPLWLARDGVPPLARTFTYEEEQHDRWDPPFVDLRRMGIDTDCLSRTKILSAVRNILADRRFILKSYPEPYPFRFDLEFYKDVRVSEVPNGHRSLELVLEGKAIRGVYVWEAVSMPKHQILDLFAPPESLERKALQAAWDIEWVTPKLAWAGGALQCWQDTWWYPLVKGYSKGSLLRDIRGWKTQLATSQEMLDAALA